jgi:glucose-1-phosphate adenylyltransferase
MGNYLFNANLLLRALRSADMPPDADFGRDLLPRLAATRRVRAYDFCDNRIGGAGACEEPGYWRDVGTLDAYFDAHLDTLGERPRFSLYNPAWPIGADGDDRRGPARYAAAADCTIGSARLDLACLRTGVTVYDGAHVVQSIVMDGCVVGRGARLLRTIVDEGNCIPDGACIGGALERTRGRFPVSAGGVTVVPRGTFARHA